MIKMNNFCNIQYGELIITSYDNKILWSGKPFGISVIDCKKVIDSDDVIVLLNYWGINIKEHRNILRLNTLGEIMWEVARPLEIFRPIKNETENDNLYTGITGLNKNTLKAFAFCGYSDTIDIHNGQIIKSEFVK